MEAVANWLWQGALVAVVATLLGRAPRTLGATARYRLWWFAMAIVLVLPLATAASGWLAPAARDTAAPTDLSALAAPAMQVRIGAPPPWVAIALVVFWALWAAVSAARVVASTVGLRNARRAARPFPPAREARLEHWMALSGRGRPARLVLSDDVRYAAVLGGRAPLIAISRAVASALDDRDLDRIVVHEWAHVQRRDDCDRVLQLAIRAVAGLHPGVWWLDRRIHLDRETACDDWTVNVTGSAKAYAASLTRLATIDRSTREAILLPAALASSDLTRRVMRLLDEGRTRSTNRWHATMAAIVPALVAAAVLVTNVQLVAIERDAAAAVRSAFAVVTSAVDLTPAVDESARQTAVPPHSAPRVPRRSTVRTQSPTSTQANEHAVVSVDGRAESRGEQQAGAELRTPLAMDVRPPSELPGTLTPAPSRGSSAPVVSPDDAAPRTPWGAAADAGVQVGRGSQTAAVKTAGFFSKLGKSIARSF